MDIREKFINTAKYCENVYGVQYDRSEMFFCCCECGDPLYFDDYPTQRDWDEACEEFGFEDVKPWSFCPVCGVDFEMSEEEDE